MTGLDQISFIWVLMAKLNSGSVSRGEEEVAVSWFDPWIGRSPGEGKGYPL